MKSYHLTIVTPQEVFFEGSVVSLVVPGGAGSFGVLADHAPIISTLIEGPLALTTEEGEKRQFQIGSGFFDLLNNQATLLTTSITSTSP